MESGSRSGKKTKNKDATVKISQSIPNSSSDLVAYASSARMVPPDSSKVPHPAFNDGFDDGEYDDEKH